jgi:hypothetical protein
VVQQQRTLGISRYHGGQISLQKNFSFSFLKDTRKRNMDGLTVND